ncbi:hypothetical protein FUT63_00165 [Extensimonas vulgaris]|nr:hypothetical protein FUT63_00165 [Extensimonas vulgaris]
MQILAIPPGIAAVCALPRPKIHRFYLSHQASNTTLECVTLIPVIARAVRPVAIHGALGSVPASLGKAGLDCRAPAGLAMTGCPSAKVKSSASRRLPPLRAGRRKRCSRRR